MVPIHNNGDPKRPKGIPKVIGDYVHAQSTTSKSLAVGMLQQRKQREIKAIGKATEAAKEAYEGLPIQYKTNK